MRVPLAAASHQSGENSERRLTLKELLELRLVHVVRDVAHKQLLGVGVANRAPTLRLAGLPLPHWNRGQCVRHKYDDVGSEAMCDAASPGLGPLWGGGGPPGLCSRGRGSLWGLCALVWDSGFTSTRAWKRQSAGICKGQVVQSAARSVGRRRGLPALLGRL